MGGEVFLRGETLLVATAINKFHMGDSFSWGGYMGFLLEMCSKVTENGAIGQNTYEFLLVLYSNFGRISYCFSATVDFLLK